MSAQSSRGRWQFWIDRGGTFTDVVARRPDGAVTTHKLLSENPERYDDAAIAGIRHFLGLGADDPIPGDAIEAVKMGTTVATNALLERKGERTVLFITQGLADQLRIAYQNRPRIFARHIVLPELLYAKVVEVTERIGAHGEVLSALDAEQARRDLRAAYDEGSARSPSCSCTGIAIPHTRHASRRSRASSGFRRSRCRTRSARS